MPNFWDTYDDKTDDKARFIEEAGTWQTEIERAAAFTSQAGDEFYYIDFRISGELRRIMYSMNVNARTGVPVGFRSIMGHQNVAQIVRTSTGQKATKQAVEAAFPYGYEHADESTLVGLTVRVTARNKTKKDGGTFLLAELTILPPKTSASPDDVPF
jgi:hypothetical protein